ncbi:MAG TPA: extracellular solute-binding protein [Tissierellaceae bacterium]
MMKKCFKIIGIFLTMFILTDIVTSLLSSSKAAEGVNNVVYKSSEIENGISVKRNRYDDYIKKYENIEQPDDEIVIEAREFKRAEPEVEIIENYEGMSGSSVLTKDEGFIEWTFNVERPGLYNVKVVYYPIEGKGTDIEREVWINGELPFFEAKYITFGRIWKDAENITQDSRGNDIRPRQIESPGWVETFIKGYTSYYQEPYKFYFKEGENTIRFVSVKEPMIIRSIIITQAEEIPTYEQVKEIYKEKGYVESRGQFIKIQGEKASYKSDPTLYPIYDRSSPLTEPYHSSKIRLNTIGGYRWSLLGQWIAWEFEVPETGLYKIAIKSRQNIAHGLFTTRSLLIDGKVPFKEVENIKFNYGNDWEMKELQNEKGEPFLFYLEKGKHEIRLEVALGDLAEILRIAENSVYQLNAAYRRMLMILGASPDPYRDYQLEREVPDAIEILKQQSEVMKYLSQRLQDYTGQRGSYIALLDRLAYQLEDLAKHPETIPTRWSDFKTNIGALGTWILSVKEQPLEIDYIIIASPDQEMPRAEANFIEKLVHEVRAFAATFYEDYSSIGEVYGDAITVWTHSGRDQAQILKQMIDDTFTPKTGIRVNLKVVPAGVLLPATVAGRGPDIAMQVGIEEPINYAIRGAVVNLVEFADFEEVSKRFHPSALTPYQFNGGVYALPETQDFPMLFYRIDILEELGINPPQTWDDFYRILPEIQKNNMEVGIPTQPTGLPTYAMFLYQMGGTIYDEEGKSCRLDEEIAIEAFRKWVLLYVNYKLPLEYDFANRFRTGEMPIGIANYQLYNQLAVFAPEIRGLWAFIPVPGTVKSDGTIDRSVAASGLGCMMMKTCKNKEAAWEFMKWWTSAEIQERFGREMESLLGTAARYGTANLEAMSRLPWTTNDYKNLSTQWEWVKGIPQIPGAYFTPRHVDNAFRKVVYQGEDIRETLLDYVRVINDEIAKKRKEFGLE